MEEQILPPPSIFLMYVLTYSVKKAAQVSFSTNNLNKELQQRENTIQTLSMKLVKYLYAYREDGRGTYSWLLPLSGFPGFYGEVAKMFLKCVRLQKDLLQSR